MSQSKMPPVMQELMEKSAMVITDDGFQVVRGAALVAEWGPLAVFAGWFAGVVVLEQ